MSPVSQLSLDLTPVWSSVTGGVETPVVSWPLSGAWHDGGMQMLSCLSSPPLLYPCLTGPSQLVLHLTTNPGPTPLFLSWLFINQPGRPRLARWKIRSYQYSTLDGEGNKGVFSGDIWFCIWKSDGQSSQTCRMSLKKGQRPTFACASSYLINLGSKVFTLNISSIISCQTVCNMQQMCIFVNSQAYRWLYGEAARGPGLRFN